MRYPVYYLLGVVFVGLGIRHALRGYAYKSKPRIVNGIAIALVGVSQFLRCVPFLSALVIAVAVTIFIYSLTLLAKEHRN